MKYALVNPNWSFERSIYFGCREPHLPLEYGYAKALLEREGHETAIVDGQLERLTHCLTPRLEDQRLDLVQVLACLELERQRYC